MRLLRSRFHSTNSGVITKKHGNPCTLSPPAMPENVYPSIVSAKARANCTASAFASDLSCSSVFGRVFIFLTVTSTSDVNERNAEACFHIPELRRSKPIHWFTTSFPPPTSYLLGPSDLCPHVFGGFTRSATPSIALLHRQIHRQKSVPVSNPQLPPDFEGKQSAWQEGISSRFNEVGRCTSRQNSGFLVERRYFDVHAFCHSRSPSVSAAIPHFAAHVSGDPHRKHPHSS